MNYQEMFSPFLNAAADEARRIALSYFRKSFSVDEKSDRTPVTQADRQIEASFRAQLAKIFPEHGIIGEEYGMDKAGAEFVWVIDPIDGTKSFAVGRPLFGTVIGLMHHGQPVAGMVDQAFTEERWIGFQNAGAHFNGRKISVAAERPLETARSFFGAPNIFTKQDLPNILRLSEIVKWPHFGCDCYAYGLLAMGCIDLVIEQDLKWHDIAGILPLITEAGGHVQSWSGKALSENWDGTIIAASGQKLAQSAAEFLAR
ncbi:MAG: inositol monophosphatase family protein [Pseudomonadota bacterium]